jgi:hypothetical protein
MIVYSSFAPFDGTPQLYAKGFFYKKEGRYWQVSNSAERTPTKPISIVKAESRMI